MENFTFFLANNYVTFIVVAVILICALTGYLVDNYEQKKGIDREAKAHENDIKMIDFTTMDQSKAVYQEEAKADLDLSGYSGQQVQPQTDGFVSAETLNNMNFETATPMTDPNAGYQYVDPNTQYQYVDPNSGYQYTDPNVQYQYTDPNAGYVDPNSVATAYTDPAMYNQPVAETTSTPTLQIGIEKK